MTDYVKTTNFTAKDTLANTDPNKIIKGSLFDTEFNNIQVNMVTKEDKANKAVANGYASLDTNVLIPLAQIPGTLTGKSADQVDGYHAGNLSGQVAVSNGTLCTNLNADRLRGYDPTASNAINTIMLRDGSGVTSVLGITASTMTTTTLNGRNIGNASGNIPISNLTQNTGLYAEAATKLVHATSGVHLKVYEFTATWASIPNAIYYEQEVTIPTTFLVAVISIAKASSSSQIYWPLLDVTMSSYEGKAWVSGTGRVLTSTVPTGVNKVRVGCFNSAGISQANVVITITVLGY